jgi:hypothetical protein
MQAAVNQLSVNDVLSQFDNLHEQVKVYVPSTVDVNQGIDNSSYVNQVASEVAGLFGGSSISEQRGCWMSQVGLVMEYNGRMYLI